MSGRSVLSTLTVATVGLVCKGFLRWGFCSSVTVKGLDNLLFALREREGSCANGVVTVSNHISVLDDPLAWGIMPTSSFFTSRTTRWSLGASDIMFTNPVFSNFFRKGQVIETFRGKGIYQSAVDTAIEKLNAGEWVHLFGEGKVNQPHTYPTNGESARLPRFKWGTARIIMETKQLPTIIPMWLTGFDKIMPEPRGFPRFLPRMRKSVSITFGEPLDHSKLQVILDPWHERSVRKLTVKDGGGTGTGVDEVPFGVETANKRQVRCDLTDVIQREVETLGRQISGPLLGKSTATTAL